MPTEIVDFFPQDECEPLVATGLSPGCRVITSSQWDVIAKVRTQGVPEAYYPSGFSFKLRVKTQAFTGVTTVAWSPLSNLFTIPPPLEVDPYWFQLNFTVNGGAPASLFASPAATIYGSLEFVDSLGNLFDPSPIYAYDCRYPVFTYPCCLYVDKIKYTLNWNDCLPPGPEGLDEPDESAANIAPLIADTYNEYLAVAFTGSRVNNGKRQLQIAVTPNEWISNNNISTYRLQEIEQNSPIGLVYLPNGNLLVSYMVGSNAKYRINRKFGLYGPADWEPEHDLSPDVAQMLASGRSVQDINFALRVAL